MNMDQFFSKAGALISTTQLESGTSPQRVFTVRFTYENGYSEYNGREWTYQIDRK